MPDVTPPQSASANAVAGPRVVVSVGTDHHPFDRLIGWINDFLATRPEQTATFFVQWGSAAVRPACAGAPFLSTGELNALLDHARVLVCHGGPGLIADAWARGQAPVVVPRLRRLGEAVDDHQVEFCAKLAALGRVRLARTAAALAHCLDDEFHGNPRPRLSAPDSDVEATVERFAVLIDELVARPRRWLPFPGRAGGARRVPAARAGTAGADGLPTDFVPEEPHDMTRKPVARPAGSAGAPKEKQE